MADDLERRRVRPDARWGSPDRPDGQQVVPGPPLPGPLIRTGAFVRLRPAVDDDPWDPRVPGGQEVTGMGNELDLELADAARQSLPGRSSQDATQGHAQLLAARAVAENRPSTLDQGAIAHLQAVAGNGGVSRLLEDDAPEQVRSVLSRRGEPLEAAVAADMSARLGTDLSDVRIHRDAAASESARAVNANAYTVGSDIVFQSGQYDPSGPAGQRTLAHELTHVVQQRQGSVDGTDVGGGLALSDPADRFEREASVAAERLAASAARVPTPSPVTAARTLDEDTTAQRVIDIETVADEEEQPEEEEEEGAGLIGQRQAEDEDEEEESVAG